MKNLKKYLACSLVAVTALTSTLTPVWGNAAQPDFSLWALSTLNEGERYGIFPLDWYQESFKATVSNEKYKVLIAETEEKIAELNLPKNPAFKRIAQGNTNSREDVLIALYNIVGQYKMPEGFFAAGETPIAFMQKNQIVVGDGKALRLTEKCTTEQAILFSTKLIQHTFHSLSEGSEGFLWKATKGDTTVYMLGSIHIGDTKLYPMDKALMDAFKQSDALLVEANLFDMAGRNYMIEKSSFTDGKTLKSVVSKETYEKVQQVFAKYNVPEEAYAKLKPWSVANSLSVMAMTNADSQPSAASSANLGIDMYYSSKALIENKPIVELEGIKFQTDLFDAMTPKLQEQQLTDALDALLVPKTDAKGSNESAELLNFWLEAWRTGDVAGFTKSYESASQTTDTAITTMLFGERDKNMTAKIAEILEKKEKKTYFVVVGSGHLTIKNSVIDRLKAMGYGVENVDLDKK